MDKIRVPEAFGEAREVLGVEKELHLTRVFRIQT